MNLIIFILFFWYLFYYVLFRNLFFVWFFIVLGNGIVFIVLVFVVLDIGGFVIDLGLVVVVCLIFNLVFLLIGGVLVDCYF